MDIKINKSVASVVNTLTKYSHSSLYRNGRALVEKIYQDNVWTLQVSFSTSGLVFRVSYIYKNGKSDFSDITISEFRQVLESNTQVRVRKDLLSKIETISAELNKTMNKTDNNKIKEIQKGYMLDYTKKNPEKEINEQLYLKDINKNSNIKKINKESYSNKPTRKTSRRHMGWLAGRLN